MPDLLFAFSSERAKGAGYEWRKASDSENISKKSFVLGGIYLLLPIIRLYFKTEKIKLFLGCF